MTYDQLLQYARMRRTVRWANSGIVENLRVSHSGNIIAHIIKDGFVSGGEHVIYPPQCPPGNYYCTLIGPDQMLESAVVSMPTKIRMELHRRMRSIEGRDPCWSTADLAYDILTRDQHKLSPLQLMVIEAIKKMSDADLRRLQLPVGLLV